MAEEQPHNPPTHLLEPYHYISSTPGKNIRSALIDCFQLWLRVPPSDNDASSSSSSSTDKLSEIKSIIASLHNASLLIDDIEDNSKLRRGNPVAHSIFGVANCINCANYVYFLALERCRLLGSEDALKVGLCHCVCLWILPLYLCHVVIVAALNI
jgi:geranylgeranyl diphosphate synthase type 3